MFPFKNRNCGPLPPNAGVAAGCLLGALLSPPLLAATDDAKQSITRESVETQSSNESGRSVMAREWGLSPQEWARYELVMKGPRGIYSPGLDPLTALGIEAESAEERQRFAELQVQAERRRVDKELAYQRAYDQAFARIYPDEKVIQLTTPQSSPATRRAVMKSDGRLAVFVEEDCTSCIAQVQNLQEKKLAFDLYFVGGQSDDERIRRWAILAGIDPTSVHNRKITLNHDNGRWLDLRLGGNLPALVREVNGKWQRQ